MDDLEKFLDELRDALLGSEVMSAPWIQIGMHHYIRPIPHETDRMVNVVREMFRDSDWKLVARGKKS